MKTKTRKQIIELLEPYMDKTLNEGCLVEFEREWGYGGGKHMGNIYFGDYVVKNNKLISGYISVTCKTTTHHKVTKDNLIKIIGHYDITAVLKYVLDEGYEVETLKLHFLEGDFSIYEKGEFGRNIGRLRSKPLHLYSEQEDEHLLKLLTKLGKQKD